MRYAAAVRVPLAITTSDRVDEELVRRARAAAAESGVPFLPRRRKLALSRLLDGQADALVVFEVDAVSLVDREGTLRFSAGLAHLRIKQLDKGVEEDMLVRHGELRDGERVLDCTCGLGADAQVAARLVGPGGAVTALEKSLPLYLLVRHGLPTLGERPRSARIEVRHRDALEFLREQPDRAFDVLLFDPMFGRERKASAAFESLRRFADYTPLDLQTLTEARRVARRCVLIKASRYSTDLKKLGLSHEPTRPGATILWAKVSAL